MIELTNKNVNQAAVKKEEPAQLCQMLGCKNKSNDTCRFLEYTKHGNVQKGCGKRLCAIHTIHPD